MVILVCVIGFLLRFLMLQSGKSLWGDEWYSIDMAQKSISEVFASITQDVHPPFFYILLNLLVKWFGFHEWVFRLTPFLAGVGTVYLVYVLGQKITGDKKSGLLSAFLVAISPYWLQLSNEIRSYSLFGFVSCLGTLIFLQLTETKKTGKWKIVYVLIALSVVYLEHYGWFWLFGLNVYMIYLYATRRIADKSLIWLQALILVFCLPALGIVVYQAVHTEPVFHASRMNVYYSLPSMLKKVTAVFWHFACGPNFSMLSADRVMQYIFQSPAFWFSFVLTVVLFLLSLISLAEFVWKRKDFFILLLFMLFFPIFCLLIIYPIRLHSRYLSFAAPYFFILIGNILEKEKRRFWPAVFLLILVGNYLYTDYQFIKMKTDPLHREDYPSMIRYTFEQAGPHDVVCGFLLSPQTVPYYERQLNLHRSTIYIHNCFELSEDLSATKFNKIWIMGYMDMDEKTNVRNMTYFQEQFGKVGFNSFRRAQKFGGENGLNSVYVFEK